MAKEKETVPISLITLTLGIAVTGISFWYGQNNGLLPEQVSEQAPLVDDFFQVMVTIGTALFLLVEGAIVFIMIKFRRKKGDETDAPYVEGNLPLEIFWTAIPAFIVIGLGIYSVDVYSQMGGFDAIGSGIAHNHSHHSVEIASLPGSEANLLMAEGDNREYGMGATPVEGKLPPDLTVNVTGIQYAWLFNYPDTGIVAGELHVPVGKDVQLSIEAQDVIHSFWLPQFRIKQDAIPGEKTLLRFVATQTGHYPVVCAELCGAYHGAMRTEVIVHNQEEYNQWVAENQIAAVPDLNKAVAVQQERSDGAFLEPFVEQMGVNEHTVTALQHLH
ncbi:cytochrome c oxidase subunit II [Spirulina subsalsa FACHB-351]|uniref:Cytochrome c oxidase subunit 2 n=1 Tax=Spirulina subsalsa FACHB-351 TaxID=234711 RepID=A0ABT3L980_9CYAN|nr:cytochrome c oxidase subunit II [Spirulina subsalsa]MCW6038071.1 cytochrome c oxidase subunit II [Spirulina subsalsa FACHB-351]